MVDRARIVVACAAALWLALPNARVAGAQTVKLNGPLTRPDTLDVRSGFVFSADGARMVFIADALSDEVFELFVAPADASTLPVRLNAPLPERGDVLQFALGAGGRVVYMATQEAFWVPELYSVPVDGSAGPTKLSGAPGTSRAVESIQLSPDGSIAVFEATTLPGASELFSVPIDGSAAPVLLEAGGRSGPVTRHLIHPDGTRVLFTRTGDDSEHLYIVPIDASSPELDLAESVLSVGGESGFREVGFSADGRHALFVDLEFLFGELHLRAVSSVPLDGSHAAWRLSGSPDDTAFPFFASSSTGRVLYTEAHDLYSSAIDGTGRVRLDPPGWTPRHYALAPGGTIVVFSAYVTPGDMVLFSAPVDGSQAATALTAPGGFTVWNLEVVAPATVVYSGSASSSAPGGLYALPLGGEARLLSGPPGAGVPLDISSRFDTTAGGEVVFQGAWIPASELFAVPLDGKLPPRRISAPLGAGGAVTEFRIAPDANRVAYLANERGPSAHELFVTTIAAGSSPRPYVPPGPVVGDVLAFRASPGGESVVYLADQISDESFTLFLASADSRAAAVALLPIAGGVTPDFVHSPTGEHVAFRNASDALLSVGTAPGFPTSLLDTMIAAPFEFSADGTRVVYRRENGSSSNHELRSVPADRGAAPVRLHPPVPPDRGVTDFQVGPAGRVVFRGDLGANNVFGLFSAPVDGSGPAISLDARLSGQRDAGVFRIGPDGRQVVYLADARFDGRDELFAAPVEGGRLPRRLSATMIAAGDVTHFALTPHGERVVYRADALSDSRFELFAVLVDGRSAGPARAGTGEQEPRVARLTDLTGTRSVEPDFQIGVDGRQVFYRANPGSPARFELFRVAVDGSTPPVALSALAAGGSVLSFALSPDKSRAVYLARVDGVDELHSVPAYGGPPVRLERLPAFAGIESYRVDPEGRALVYRCDRQKDGVLELFGVPLDGSAPARQINDRLPTGGNVEPDYTLLSGGRVVYRADQEANDVFELFLGRVRP